MAENVLLRLRWRAPDGRDLEGLGEAAPYAYYGELRGTVTAALDAFAPLLGDDPFALDAVLDALDSRLHHHPARKPPSIWPCTTSSARPSNGPCGSSGASTPPGAL